MTESKTQYVEGSAWFWRIFGGAIIGLVSVLMLSYFNNINNSIDRSTMDLRSEIKELRLKLELQKEKVGQLEQGNSKFAGIEKSLWSLQTSLDEYKQKLVACDAGISNFREDLKTIREWNREIARQVQEVRDKVATIISPKKD